MYEPYSLEKYSDIENNKEILYITKQNYKNDAPELVNHLEKYREIMDNRRENKNNRLKFYHLHWSRDETFFQRGGKILSIRKCSIPTFVYTDKEAYTMMSVNIIKTNRYNMKVLSLILNSKLVAFWLRYNGKLQGGNFQIDKEPILLIPIIEIDKEDYFSSLYDKLFTLKQMDKDINSIVDKIDILIYKLYNLTYEEALIIDSTISIDDFQLFESHSLLD